MFSGDLFQWLRARGVCAVYVSSTSPHTTHVYSEVPSCLRLVISSSPPSLYAIVRCALSMMIRFLYPRYTTEYHDEDIHMFVWMESHMGLRSHIRAYHTPEHLIEMLSYLSANIRSSLQD